MTTIQREQIVPGAVVTLTDDPRSFTVDEYPDVAGYFAIVRLGSRYGRVHFDLVVSVTETGRN